LPTASLERAENGSVNNMLPIRQLFYVSSAAQLHDSRTIQDELPWTLGTNAFADVMTSMKPDSVMGALS